MYEEMICERKIIFEEQEGEKRNGASWSCMYGRLS